MEETNEFWVEEVRKKFCLFKVVDTASGRKRALALYKTFPNNPKTRRIYKIYKVNYSLGMKLFKAYSDKNP